MTGGCGGGTVGLRFTTTDSTCWSQTMHFNLRHVFEIKVTLFLCNYPINRVRNPEIICKLNCNFLLKD